MVRRMNIMGGFLRGKVRGNATKISVRNQGVLESPSFAMTACIGDAMENLTSSPHSFLPRRARDQRSHRGCRLPCCPCRWLRMTAEFASPAWVFSGEKWAKRLISLSAGVILNFLPFWREARGETCAPAGPVCAASGNFADSKSLAIFISKCENTSTGTVVNFLHGGGTTSQSSAPRSATWASWKSPPPSMTKLPPISITSLPLSAFTSTSSMEKCKSLPSKDPGSKGVTRGNDYSKGLLVWWSGSLGMKIGSLWRYTCHCDMHQWLLAFKMIVRLNWRNVIEMRPLSPHWLRLSAWIRFQMFLLKGSCQLPSAMRGNMSLTWTMKALDKTAMVKTLD